MTRAKIDTGVWWITVILVFAVLLWGGEATVLSEEAKRVSEKTSFAEAKILDGQWVRPDGGYRLVIEDIGPDGRVKVSYYNPSKINVQEAKWKMEGNNVHLFVELRDANYPGSKYSLRYIEERDALEGSYFQAVHRQTFGVAFMRITAK